MGESSQSLPKGFGRIIRDETGKVIGVELPEEENQLAIEADKTMESLEPDMSDEVRNLWTCHKNENIGQSVLGLVEGKPMCLISALRTWLLFPNSIPLVVTVIVLALSPDRVMESQSQRRH